MTKREKLIKLIGRIKAKDTNLEKVSEDLFVLKDKVENYKAPLIKVEIEGLKAKVIKGKDGKNAKDGLDGKRGEKGERGEMGYEGKVGKQGERGPKGDRGERGDKGDKGEPGKEGKEGKAGQDGKDADETKIQGEIYTRLSQRTGGGGMNRQIFIGGVDPLKKYTDINLKAGANITLQYANNETTKKVDVTIIGTDTDTGIVRSISSVAIDTAAGSTAGTDYVYLCSATLTITLPTAVGNSNLYTIKNIGTGIVTIATTGGQTIDGDTTIIMPVQYTSVDLISNSANWSVT